MIFGCMNLGGYSDKLTKLENEYLAFSALNQSITSGFYRFDHADIYMKGNSEKIFGQFFSKSGIERNEIWIQSKAGIILKNTDFQSNHYNSSKEYLKTKILQSIENLKCDYLDSFLIHRPDLLTHPNEIGEVLDEFLSKGIIKSFGVSNFTKTQIEYYNHYLPVEIKYNQIHLSLLQTDLFMNMINQNQYGIETGNNGLIEFCKVNDIEIQAYSPLAKGKLSNSKHNPDLHLLIHEIAQDHKTSIEAIMIAWLLTPPFSITPVIGTLNIDRIKAIAEAPKIELSRFEWYKLMHASTGKNLP